MIAQNDCLLMCYISFNTIKELRRIYEDVMTEKLKIVQFLPYSFFTLQLISKCFIPSYRATYVLHFILWLLRCMLCLERIMFHNLRISSLCKHFFKQLYLCLWSINYNGWRFIWKLLQNTTFYITRPNGYIMFMRTLWTQNSKNFVTFAIFLTSSSIYH